jgi:hypothetical protein
LSISPDGGLLAFPSSKDFPPVRVGWQILVVSLVGRKPIKALSVPGGIAGVTWTQTGKGLQYLFTENRVTSLWEQPVDGGAPIQRIRFSDGPIADFAWSVDHQSLLTIHGQEMSDVALMRNLP